MIWFHFGSCSTFASMVCGISKFTLWDNPNEKMNFFPSILTAYPTHITKSFFSYPWVTPSIIFASNVLESPQRFRCSSFSTAVIAWVPSTLILTPFTKVWESCHLGPLTTTVEPLIWSSTPVGISIAFFPIFDITRIINW